MIFAASCTQNAQKQKPAEQAEKPQQEVEQAIIKNDAPNSATSDLQDPQLIKWMKEIYYKLPASVMPDYLKTEAQRCETDVFHEYTVNHVIENKFHEDGYDQWEMAVYPTEDKKNVVVIVLFGSGLDGYELHSDKTLNYNIATGAFTEIERPMDPITVDELIDESLFDNPKLAAKAKAFFIKNKQKVHYNNFDKDGFRICADIFGYDDSDYYGSQNSVESSRKWNGRRFVKGARWYLNEDNEWIIK